MRLSYDRSVDTVSFRPIGNSTTSLNKYGYRRSARVSYVIFPTIRMSPVSSILGWRTRGHDRTSEGHRDVGLSKVENPPNQSNPVTSSSHQVWHGDLDETQKRKMGVPNWLLKLLLRRSTCSSEHGVVYVACSVPAHKN